MRYVLSIYKICVLFCITLVCVCCDSTKSAPSIMGVKVAGYGWIFKQTFSNRGFSVIREEKNAFVMEGKYNDNICYLCVMTGKWDKVLVANIKIMGWSLDKEYEALEKEYNEMYTASQDDDTEELKTRQWLKYYNNELVGKVILEGKISAFDTGQKTPEFEVENPFGGNPFKVGGASITMKNISEIDLTVFNALNIEKYKTE